MNILFVVIYVCVGSLLLLFRFFCQFVQLCFFLLLIFVVSAGIRGLAFVQYISVHQLCD